MASRPPLAPLPAAAPAAGAQPRLEAAEAAAGALAAHARGTKPLKRVKKRRNSLACLPDGALRGRACAEAEEEPGEPPGPKAPSKAHRLAADLRERFACLLQQAEEDAELLEDLNAALQIALQRRDARASAQPIIAFSTSTDTRSPAEQTDSTRSLYISPRIFPCLSMGMATMSCAGRLGTQYTPEPPRNYDVESENPCRSVKERVMLPNDKISLPRPPPPTSVALRRSRRRSGANTELQPPLLAEQRQGEEDHGSTTLSEYCSEGGCESTVSLEHSGPEERRMAESHSVVDDIGSCLTSSTAEHLLTAVPPHLPNSSPASPLLLPSIVLPPPPPMTLPPPITSLLPIVPPPPPPPPPSMPPPPPYLPHDFQHGVHFQNSVPEGNDLGYGEAQELGPAETTMAKSTHKGDVGSGQEDEPQSVMAQHTVEEDLKWSSQVQDDGELAAGRPSLKGIGWAELGAPGLLHTTDIASIGDEAALLSVAFEAAVRSEKMASEGAQAMFQGLRELVVRLGALTHAHSAAPADGSRRRVSFAVYDFSFLSPPKAQREGSELEQEKVIAHVAELLIEQQRLFSGAAPETLEAQAGLRCLRRFAVALAELAVAPPLHPRLRHAAGFYASQVEDWADGRALMLQRRLSELLSSILRFHLSMIFAEAEGGDDPMLGAIRSRVREHAASIGFVALSGHGAEEYFSALVSNSLLSLTTHEHLVPPESELPRGPEDPNWMRLNELDSELKDSLLSWARAHAVLLQVFGLRDQLAQLRHEHANEHHFARLAQYAQLVHELGLPDESYFTPLRDLDGFVLQLHRNAPRARAIQEGLLVYAINGRRRSRRLSCAGDK